MEQRSKKSSYAVSLILYAIVIVVSAAPVLLEQVCRPERSLFCANAWGRITKNSEAASWSASDGSSPEHVSVAPTEDGLSVTIQPTESPTREAFFSESLIPGSAFALSTEIRMLCGYMSGLAFRGNSQGEYYLFLVSSSTYTVEILERKSGQDRPREAIIPNTKVSRDIGWPRHLAVVGKGRTYYFYVNGVYVDTMSDSRLYGDRVGVEAFT
ncbi:MAG: hypothetical protein AB1750_05390 [Chloroflexota bacterium]